MYIIIITVIICKATSIFAVYRSVVPEIVHSPHACSSRGKSPDFSTPMENYLVGRAGSLPLPIHGFLKPFNLYTYILGAENFAACIIRRIPTFSYLGHLRQRVFTHRATSTASRDSTKIGRVRALLPVVHVHFGGQFHYWDFKTMKLTLTLTLTNAKYRSKCPRMILRRMRNDDA